MRASWIVLVGLVCFAEVLTMLGFSAFAALLPWYRDHWGLSNAEAGWIGSAFFAGYTLAVPFLVALTDRIDPRRIYLASALVTGVASLGFAWLAHDVVTAALLRAIAGAGLAGTYMPGLKGLCDHIAPQRQSRVTALYTSCFVLGSAISFPFADMLHTMAGPATPFAVAGVAAMLAGAIVITVMPPALLQSKEGHARHLLDFMPVFRNRSVMAYTLCYAIHSWELMGFYAWVVAFLVFTAKLHGIEPVIATPAIVAAVITLIGVPAMIFGNEMAIRLGRARTAAAIMALSGLVAFLMGATAIVSYGLAVAACVVYGLTTIADSAVVTAGALGSADPKARGAALAVHSTLGFGGAMFGPLAFGIVLDVAGNDGMMGWGIAFAHLGVVVLIGPIIVGLIRPVALAGDRGFAHGHRSHDADAR